MTHSRRPTRPLARCGALWSPPCVERAKLDEPRLTPRLLKLVAELQATVFLNAYDQDDMVAADAIHQRYVVTEVMLGTLAPTLKESQSRLGARSQGRGRAD